MGVSPHDRTSPERWQIDLPSFRVEGRAVRFTGNRPTWHSVIYFGALADLIPVGSHYLGTDGQVITVCTYAACFIAALVVGKVMKTKDLGSRMFSGVLGNIGFILAPFDPWQLTALGDAHPALPTAQMLLSSAMVVLNCTGEALYRLRPASRQADAS